MKRTFTVLGQSFTAALLLFVGMASAQAAVDDYTYYTITGNVLFADDPNLWDLTTGQNIEARVSIFGDATGDGTYNIDSMYLDLGATGLNTGDLGLYGGITLTLSGGAVSDFYFANNDYTFESSFTAFTDGVESTAVGEWTNIQQTAVPVPAAVWLFGSALGALGWVRRRKVTS